MKTPTQLIGNLHLRRRGGPADAHEAPPSVETVRVRCAKLWYYGDHLSRSNGGKPQILGAVGGLVKGTTIRSTLVAGCLHFGHTTLPTTMATLESFRWSSSQTISYPSKVPQPVARGALG